MRNVKKSGTSREAVEKAENEFKQLKFLTWLDEFVQPRPSRSSFDDTSENGETQNNNLLDPTDNHDNDDVYDKDDSPNEAIENADDEGEIENSLEINYEPRVNTCLQSLSSAMTTPIVSAKRTQEPIKKQAPPKRKLQKQKSMKWTNKKF